MTLQAQLLDVPLFGGMDQKTTPEYVAAGRQIDLQNVVFAKGGKVQKRNGFSALSTTVVKRVVAATEQTTTWSSGQALATRGEELLEVGVTAAAACPQASTQCLAAWSSSAGRWSARDVIDSCLVSSYDVVRSRAEATWVTSAYCNGYVAVVAGGWLYVYDATTWVQVGPTRSVGSEARVVACGTLFVVSYVATPGNTLFLVSFDTTTRALASVTNLGLNAAEHPYDIAPYDSTRVFVGYRAVGGNVYGALVTVSTGSVTLMATGEATTTDVQVSCASGETLFVAWVNSSARIRVMGFTAAGATTLAATTVGGTGVTRISACRGDATSTMALVYQRGTTGGISWLRVTNAGAAVGQEPNAGLWEYTIVSRPWLNLGRMYCALRYGPTSSLHPTYFVMQLDLSPSGASTAAEQAVPVATLAPRIAGSATSTTEAFAQVTQNSVTAEWYLPLRVLTLTSGSTTFSSGARLYTLAFVNATSGAASYRFDEPQGSTTFAGGVGLAYDGAFCSETGYPHPPEGVAVSSSSTGGSIGAGTYSYAVIYAWTDALGRVHRSQPSVPVATSALTGSTNSVTVTVPTLSGSWRTRFGGAYAVDGVSVVAEVYRTLASGATSSSLDGFYYVGSCNVGNASTSTATLLDILSDTTIATRAQPYTAGGVLPAQLPPAHSVVAVSRNRTWVNSAEDEDVVYVSRDMLEGEPPAFNDALIVYCIGGGAVTAIVPLDSRTIVFKATAVFVVHGDGPDDTGGGTPFTVERLGTVTLGCSEPRSIVQTSDGIFFQSPQGLFMVTRGLEVLQVGAQVEDLLGVSVSHGISMATNQEIRLGTTAGDILVWNTLFKGWTRWIVKGSTGSFISPASAVVSGDVHHMLTNDGVVYYEDTTANTDSGYWVTMAVDTPWVRLGAVQGFQRARRAVLTLQNGSAAGLTVTACVDYDTTTVQTWTFSSTTMTGAEQVGLHIGPQTSAAIRFRVSDTAPDVTSANDLALVGLTLEVGTKLGTNKLPAAQRA